MSGEASTGMLRAGSAAGKAMSRALDDRKAFELRMVEIVHLGGAGIAVRRAEILGFGPGDEILMARPYGVRGEQRVTFGLVDRTAQQMKFLETFISERLESRFFQTSSKASSEPFWTLKRFMAMYIGLSFRDW